MKRIVTGHDPAGKSVFAFDGAPPKRAGLGAGGIEITELWSTDAVPSVPAGGGDPTTGRHAYFPEPGGTRFLLVRFPPGGAPAGATSSAEAAAAAKNFFATFPGLAERMEPDHPGMHTSQTVDYLVVLEGEVELELDDGAKRRLVRGDCVVQNGTRHAWRNPGTTDCVLVAAVVGAAKR